VTGCIQVGLDKNWSAEGKWLDGLAEACIRFGPKDVMQPTEECFSHIYGSKKSSTRECLYLIQLRIFRLGMLQDGNIRVRVFP
jgi:hypothetical protein